MSKLYDKLYEEFDVAFYVAAQRDENINADGSVNWDFVDADVTMHLKKNFILPEGPVYNELFDEFVEGYYIEQKECA